MVAAVDRKGLPTQAEFHAVIAGYSDRWYNACLRITRDADLAQDAVQEALLSAWNKREQYERSARLDTWVHRIAVNAALQLLRKRHPERWGEMPVDVRDDSPAPDRIHDQHQLEGQLGRALGQLSDIERTSFVLKHLEQWRLKEIADELDTSVGTIKQALFRAVKKLRVQMADLRSAS